VLSLTSTLSSLEFPQKNVLGTPKPQNRLRWIESVTPPNQVSRLVRRLPSVQTFLFQCDQETQEEAGCFLRNTRWSDGEEARIPKAPLRAQIPRMKEAGFRICFPHRTCCPKLPERTMGFSARQKSKWAHFKPPFVGSSLLSAWAAPKIQCNSALGVKLCGPFPVHFVEIECAFTATPQYAKELTAFNPIIGHVVDRFSLQCD
jgi:hypothetical protein